MVPSTVRPCPQGSSSELLTPTQRQRIDDVCSAQLRELGSDFPYDERYRVR